ncbi:MAG: regulatory protein RecX [Spirochaetota bacterium]
MDNGAHEVNSSSQNVNTHVFGRIERGASRRGLTAVSREGSSFFIPASLADTWQLAPGRELTEGEFAQLREQAELLLAQEKAVDLLARREHCVQELRQKLLQREFSPQTIESVLSRLQEKRYLDDSRFAQMWIRSRLRKQPESPAMLKAGLQKKGVDRLTAEAALADAQLDSDELALLTAERAAARGADRQKVMRVLQRKGFRPAEVLRAVDKLLL